MAKTQTRVDWFELFDTGQMDHVCELVQQAIIDASVGEPSKTMHGSLRRLLLVPLDAYLSEHRSDEGWSQVHVSAADRLREVVELLAMRFEDRFPPSLEDAEAWAARLRFAWLEFIAYGAAHLMYWKAPRDIAQRVKAAKEGRKPSTKKFGARGTADYINKHPLVKRSAAIAEIAEKLSVSERTVWRWVTRAKELNLLT